MCKQFILVLGMFLCSYMLTSAQTPTPQFFPPHGRIVPIMAVFRTVPATLFAVSFNLSVQSAVHSSNQFAGDYKDNQGLASLASLSPMRDVNTLFLTQSSLPLVQLWGGRLRFDGFMSTLHMQNLRLGPSAVGGLLDYLPARQSYPGGPRSVDLYGVSLSFHFGRNAQIGRPAQIWQSLARIVGAAW